MTLKSSAPAPPTQLAPRPARLTGRAAAVAGAFAMALALVPALAGCGGSDGPSPEEAARRRQAVAELDDFGLTTDEAECVVDELGADTVVEAPAMEILASGQPYQDAAEVCIR